MSKCDQPNASIARHQPVETSFLFSCWRSRVAALSFARTPGPGRERDKNCRRIVSSDNSCHPFPTEILVFPTDLGGWGLGSKSCTPKGQEGPANLRNSGFTLLELLIVFAVLALIVAIAIPSLLIARRSGNEASAVSSLRTLCTSNSQYRVRFGQYATGLPDLGAAGYIDEVLSNAPFEKSGYTFAYTLVSPRAQWEVEATPIGSAGERGFFVDESGVIRFTTDGSAPDDTSPPYD